MRIRFRSDGSVSGSGFNATYTSGEEKDDFFLITSSNRKIYRMDVETRSNLALPLALYNPIGVDFDPVERRLYWTDVVIKQILSASLDGTDAKAVRTFNASAMPDGIAVDPLSRLVFYTDAGNDVIAMMSMSGTSHRTIISTNLDKPRAIVLHNTHGVMFWTDWGDEPRIERANYDGAARQILHSHLLAAPNGLAVDLRNNVLYWVDAGTDLVEKSDLDGNSRRQLFQLPGHHLFGLSFHGDMLYVTDWTGAGSRTNVSYLHELRADGTTGKTFGSVPGRLNDIHIYVEDGWRSAGSNGCSRGASNCSYICIPTPDNTTGCLCPDVAAGCVDATSASTTTTAISTTTTSTTTTTTITSTTGVPTSIVIAGPSSFDTDGTLEMTLTCDPDDPRDTARVTWSVTCARQEDRKCVWKPQPPQDDGKEVTCTVLYADGQSGVGTFTVHLYYPPHEPPEIQGYTQDTPLQVGDKLTMTCLVRDGKPLVTSVIFTCEGHPDNRHDIRGRSQVQSLLVLDPVRTTDNGTRCTCTAEWRSAGLYVLSATRLLTVTGVDSDRQKTDSPNTILIIGVSTGVGAAVIIAVVVVVIIVIVKRRRGDKYEHPSRPPTQEVEMNPYARLGQPNYQGSMYPVVRQNSGKDEDQLSNIYHEIEEGYNKGGKEDNYLHPSKPAGLPLPPRPPQPAADDNYLHPSKSADDNYLHPAKDVDVPPRPLPSPGDDYLQPVKPGGAPLHPPKPDPDYLHPTKPADDYLHPVKPRK